MCPVVHLGLGAALIRWLLVHAGVLPDVLRRSNRIARSVWSARSLLPLSHPQRQPKAGASSAHSKRFATLEAAATLHALLEVGQLALTSAATPRRRVVC